MSTAANPTPTTSLLTAEEFARQHAGDYVELIDGRVVELPRSRSFQRGKACARSCLIFGEYEEKQPLGLWCSNNSFVLVARNPDRVRAPDLVYWSKAKLPDGKLTDDDLIATEPELVVEVVSPSIGWGYVLTKVGEYLGAGIPVALVLDPDSRTAMAFRQSSAPQTFEVDEDLTLPDVLPGFSVRVSKFFE